MKTILFMFLFLEISSITFEGIDVSAWQGTINWPEVAKSKYFAIIRAGTGSSNIDTYWESNYSKAKSAGVKVGAYWYSYAKSDSDARNEAKTFLKALSGKKLEWPVYYDIEEKSIFNSGITNSIAKTFCDIMESNHYYCGIYSSTATFNSYFNADIKTRYTIWLAHWDVVRPTYGGAYDLWQKKIGRCNGVNGDVDLDEGYKNFEPIMKQNHLNGY